MSNLKKTVKIKESHLVDLIDNIVNEAISTKKKTSINEMDETMGTGAAPEAGSGALQTKIDPNTIKNKSQLGRYLKQLGLALEKAPQQELGLSTVQVQQIVDLLGASLSSDVNLAQRKQAMAKLTESKKTVKLSESNLVDLIDNILNEAVEVKKQEWINEQADSRKLMEAKISKLEKALQRITESK